jgi:AraC-like DNA-binding protein
MRPVPLIRAAGVLAFARFLDSIGAPVEKRWERLGLSPRALFEPEHLLPLHQVVRFIESGAREQGVDDLGLRVGQQSTLEALGRFGTAIRAAGTLGRAFDTARSMVSAHNSAAAFWIVADRGSARICRRVRDGGGASRHIDLFTVALLIQLVRLAAGSDWTPLRVEVQSAERLSLCDTGIIGDAAISVGGAVTSVEFPRYLLTRPLPAPPASPGVSPPSLGDWLRSAPPRDFLTSLEALVADLLEAERADLVTAAEAAGMSVRSLQRRLAESGSNYSALLDRVRFRLAVRMLEDPDVKLIDVAFALGYSDAAHFSRAFRRWSSTSPLEYRRLLLGGAANVGRSG